jgi:hypothetical protein
MGEYRPELKEQLDVMLTPIPGVKTSRAFGYPAYKVNGRIFAFVGDDGMIFKLSPARADELRDQPPFSPFRTSADGKPWTGWVGLDLPDPAAYEDFFDLFIESITFVADLA